MLLPETAIACQSADADGEAERRRRTGQPAAMAGEALRVIMDMGKFQGVTAYTTPTGSLITTNFLSADGGCSGISAPCQRASI